MEALSSVEKTLESKVKEMQCIPHVSKYFANEKKCRNSFVFSNEMESNFGPDQQPRP